LSSRLEQEQVIRDGINKLSPRCKQVIEALFFEEPMPSYAALAAAWDCLPIRSFYRAIVAWSVWGHC